MLSLPDLSCVSVSVFVSVSVSVSAGDGGHYECLAQVNAEGPVVCVHNSTITITITITITNRGVLDDGTIDSGEPPFAEHMGGVKIACIRYYLLVAIFVEALPKDTEP